ncbi:MAG TPA: Ig-like domain-containing protein, partial [Mycobacteriales bacterium]|nr:Ig-like domain-containing protein [Mycobacteriales bacterium]
PSTYGQWVTFTATVATTDGVDATGTVSFSDGSTELSTVRVGETAPGVAVYPTAALTAASHQITASYSGDTIHASSASAATAQEVDLHPTSLSVTPSTTTPLAGQQVTLTATVGTSDDPAHFSYTSDPGDLIGNGATNDITSAGHWFDLRASASRIEVVVQSPAVGLEWDVVVGAPQGQTLHVGTYTGAEDVYPQPSTAPVLLATAAGRRCNLMSGDFTINRLDVTSSGIPQGVDLSFNENCNGATPAFHGHVAVGGATPPSGRVTFTDGATTLGSAPIDTFGTASIGTASITTQLSAGTHSLSAEYAGDSGYSSSNAPAISAAATQGTDTLSLSTRENPSAPGQQVTFTARVNPSGTVVPTGTVAFADGSVSLGSAPLDQTGSASVSAALTAGSHDIS